MDPFFTSLSDEYTSIYIYGLQDGLYRAGYYPQAMLWNEPFNTFFQMTYRWIDEDVNQVYDRPIRFKNGYASVIISFYHSSFFIVPYAIFCLFLCISLFLAVILYFVGRKLKITVLLEESILKMSAGDLTTPIPSAGLDELGILAAELDKLRCTLQENILKEQELHKSNQELIAALSHDLRTPLTILKGYLEIARLNRNPSIQTEYLNRCLKKTDDIKELTDRMFEYALVYDTEADNVGSLQILEIPISFFQDSIKEHADFLELAGFKTELALTAAAFCDSFQVTADSAMVKRVLNNLFSNIIKYADKKEAVSISLSVSKSLTITLKNHIKDEQNHIESTQIGLRSAGKLMEQMNGSLTLQSKKDCFTAELTFPLYKKTDLFITE